MPTIIDNINLRWGKFPNGDMILDDLSRRYSSDEIQEIVKIDLFDEKFIGNLIDYRFADLREREKKVDIKMVDFIEKHYREECCFYSLSHPKNILIRELVLRLLHFMGIKDNLFDEEDLAPSLSLHELWIYPDVYKKLNLGFEKSTYKIISSGELVLDDICQLYLQYCHNK